MQRLHDLWRGDVRPAEHPPAPSPEYLRLYHRLGEQEQKLLSLLDGEARQLFAEFSEGENLLSGYVEEDGFCRGFRLAVQLFVDALAG